MGEHIAAGNFRYWSNFVEHFNTSLMEKWDNSSKGHHNHRIIPNISEWIEQIKVHKAHKRYC